MSSTLIRKLGQARERLQHGDVAGAQFLCQEILERAPRNPDALSLFAITLLMTGRARDAVPLLEQALAAEPRHGAALENLGLAQLMLGEFPGAERALRSASALPGAPASVWMRLGVAILNQGRQPEAVRELTRALALEPHNADIHLNLGQACAQSGDTAAARRRFETALHLSPGHPDAMFNLGVLCLNAKQFDAARQWFERTLGEEAQHADALVNLGIVHEKQQRLDEAVACFRRALAANPQLAQAGNNLAHALALQGKLNEAREQYLATLRIAPRLIEAHEGLASACLALGALPGRAALLQEAESAAQRACALDPAAVGPYSVLADVYASRGAHDRAVEVLEAGFERTGAPNLLGTLAFELRHLCEWEKWREAWLKMLPLLEQDVEFGNPFSLLCEPTTAAQQLAHARRWSAAHFAIPGTVRGQKSGRAHGRLRVGYLSSNLGEHAISYLLAEVLELHDRARCEIFAYSYGPDDDSFMRDRLRQACEHFVDISRDSDDLAAARIRDDGLDILVDLNGYIRGTRTGILARRPCAVQISWIGYPGTMGADFIDYLIADGYIIPPHHENAYSERVLRMPHCYLPNDRNREVVAPLTRAEYGLPEEGFVFCCFNQPYKITPEIYACWMRLLHQVPHSVLWLPDDSPRVTDNLTRAALADGIPAGRLRFAPRLPHPAQHLARYRAADLALDTFPYTSHTTACDALWAGCLLVGLCGETFASRVSGSILSACSLPELVASTLEDYERLALRLVSDQPWRDELRARLAAARIQAPLFDPATFTHDLERLYTGLVADS